MRHDTSLRVAPIQKQALSLAEAEQAVPLCTKTLLKLIADGRLRALRVGTRWVIPVSEIQAWLDREAAEPSMQEGQQ